MQKGFVFLPIVILALLVTLGGGYVVYRSQQATSRETKQESRSMPDLDFASDGVIQTTPTPSSDNQEKPKPTPLPTSTPTAKPTVQPTPKAVSGMTCGINSTTFGDNPLSVGLTYSFSTNKPGNFYVTAGQWDFNNDGNWDTSLNQVSVNGIYSHTFPGAGTYTVKLRIQINDGTILDCGTKQVIVPQGMSLTLSGQVYKDKNCNGTKDGGEDGIPGIEVHLTKLPERIQYATVTTDSSGNYRYSKNWLGEDTLVLELYQQYVLSQYAKSAPTVAVTLSSTNQSATVDLPLVPEENVMVCSGF